MSRILIINTPALMNRGGMAVIMGSLQCLRESLPEAEITVLCHHCKEDWGTLQRICQRHDVLLKRHPWFKEHRSRPLALVHSALPAALFLFGCIIGRMASKVGLHKGPLQDSDIILDLNIDALHDHYSLFFPSWALANILLAKIAGKPVVVWSAGIGTFRRRLIRFAAKSVLNRVDVIMAREEVTKEYLKSLNVTKPQVYVTADHAFFMEAAPQARTDQILFAEGIERGKAPLIGIAASQLIPRFAFPEIHDKEERSRQYVNVMATTTDYLVNAFDAHVILITHVFSATADDRVVSRRIYERIQNKKKVTLLTGMYMADELKGIIGLCDVFIGARMHSTIASTSMGVPTIAVVYGQKSHGIIGTMMGQGEYVIEIAKCSPDQLLSELKYKTDRAWANRETIHQDLVVRAQAAKQRAAMNGSLVRDMLQGGSGGARRTGT